MLNCRICGLNVSADLRSETMRRRCEQYLYDFSGEPDIEIKYSERILAQIKSRYPQLSPDDCEQMYSAELFYNRLIDFGGFMLHSSAVETDGRAYLFSAPSGTGKSTHTSQWLKLFGGSARIINDDKPAIMLSEGRAFVCGTPWSGKSDMSLNVSVPLQGICVLKRSEVNHIEPLPSEKAVFALLNQTIRPEAPELMDRLLSLLDKIVGVIPIWELGCNISTEAAQTAYDAMSRPEI